MVGYYCNLIEGSGGIGGIFGAGVRYELRRLGILASGSDSAVHGQLVWSVAAVNAAADDVGRIGEAPAEYMRFAPRFIDKSAARSNVLDRLRFREGARTVVHNHCLDELLGRVFGSEELAQLHDSSRNPMYAVTQDAGSGKLAMLDLRRFGTEGVRAATCIGKTVPIGAFQYTDPCLQKNIDYDLLPPGFPDLPRIVISNKGHKGFMDEVETFGFFFGDYGLRNYPRYEALSWADMLVRSRMRKQTQAFLSGAASFNPEKASDVVCLLEPTKTPLGFSTTDEAVIQAGWREGVEAAHTAERFLDRVAQQRVA